MPGKIFSFWSSSEANLVINPFQPSIAFHIKTSHLCCPHIGTSQLICFANQLTGFYITETLPFNELNFHFDLFLTSLNPSDSLGPLLVMVPILGWISLGKDNHFYLLCAKNNHFYLLWDCFSLECLSAY